MLQQEAEQEVKAEPTASSAPEEAGSSAPAVSSSSAGPPGFSGRHEEMQKDEEMKEDVDMSAATGSGRTCERDPSGGGQKRQPSLSLKSQWHQPRQRMTPTGSPVGPCGARQGELRARHAAGGTAILGPARRAAAAR